MKYRGFKLNVRTKTSRDELRNLAAAGRHIEPSQVKAVYIVTTEWTTDVPPQCPNHSGACHEPEFFFQIRVLAHNPIGSQFRTEEEIRRAAIRGIECDIDTHLKQYHTEG